MSEYISGEKLNMSQIFLDDGTVVPVTMVQVESTDALNPGDVIDVVGQAKGKGFAGVIKRWGFAGGPKTHGQSDRHRAPGSIGSGTFPGKVWKGQKMAGRKGGHRVTVKNLEVVSLEGSDKVAIKGAVPGALHSPVKIRVVTVAPQEETNES